MSLWPNYISQNKRDWNLPTAYSDIKKTVFSKIASRYMNYWFLGVRTVIIIKKEKYLTYPLIYQSHSGYLNQRVKVYIYKDV